MEAIRHVVTPDNDVVLLKIPSNFVNRSLEIIVMQNEEATTGSAHLVVTGSWPEDFLALAGSMPELGDCVSEGSFEQRDNL